jgi:hypothetical protein
MFERVAFDVPDNPELLCELSEYWSGLECDWFIFLAGFEVDGGRRIF